MAEPARSSLKSRLLADTCIAAGRVSAWWLYERALVMGWRAAALRRRREAEA